MGLRMGSMGVLMVIKKSESRSFSQPNMNINSIHDQSRDLSSNGMPQWAVGMCKKLDTIGKLLSSQLQT